MVQVSLQDLKVLTRKQGSQVAEQPQLFLPSWTVILRSITEDRALAIWIGPVEGEAIARHLAGDEPTRPRPLTYAFISRLIEGLGASVQRAVISGLANDTFFSTLTLLNRGQEVVIDARPSDAINVALRAGAPIFVEQDILEQAGLRIGTDILDTLRERSRVLGRQEPEGTDWRSGLEVIREFDRARQEELERRLAERTRQAQPGAET